MIYRNNKKAIPKIGDLIMINGKGKNYYGYVEKIYPPSQQQGKGVPITDDLIIVRYPNGKNVHVYGENGMAVDLLARSGRV